MRNIDHPLCGCATIVIQKNHLSIIVRLFKPIYNGKVILMANKANSFRTQNGCVNTILCSLQSIDEK